MKRRLLTLGLLAALCAWLVSARAEEAAVAPYRPATNIYSLRAGGGRIADTYLTPLTYKGYSLGFTYERWQAMKFDPEHWVMQLKADLDWRHADSPARNNSMWYAGLDLRWTMLHRWQIADGLRLGLGGATGIMGGCIYDGRNANNPASAKGSWTVDIAGQASWNIRLGRLPVTLSYNVSLPVAGICFSPQYGELYYEMWLGNHKGLVHAAHWGNYFAMDNLLAADLRFKGVTLRLGYRGMVYSTCINHLTTRLTANQAVVGIAAEFTTLSRALKIAKENPPVIHALY